MKVRYIRYTTHISLLSSPVLLDFEEMLSLNLPYQVVSCRDGITNFRT